MAAVSGRPWPCFKFVGFAQVPRTEQKIATVDLQKVFEKYYKDRSIQRRARSRRPPDMQKERKDMVDTGKRQEGDWQKLVEKAEDQAISADERAKSKKAAEEKFREVKSTEQTIQEYDRTSRREAAGKGTPAPRRHRQRNSQRHWTPKPKPAVTRWCWTSPAKARTWRRSSFIPPASMI